ncbi:unnamed protein product [Ambrosiozyma monospora]|uniref:Unnamed protein product n=1 Tax=Ambrosiozyma monospora TaxID=43982 RepID=A0A9W6T057_AMBMO|nr:unnamed protein product [Ambrosiozyma monospora]
MLITPPNVLPRTLRSGRYEISNMLTKRKFSEGKLISSFVKFNFPNSVSAIAHGDDIEGGVFSAYSSHMRSETLNYAELQYSGLDFREECKDDKGNLKLSDFKSIIEIMKKRAVSQSEEQALAMIESNGSKGMKDTKQLSWKKFESRVLAVCLYLLEKKNLKSGDYVILNYPMCEEFIICCYACWLAGYKVIPLPPIDSEPKLIDEDCGAFVRIVKQFKL